MFVRQPFPRKSKRPSIQASSHGNRDALVDKSGRCGERRHGKRYSARASALHGEPLIRAPLFQRVCMSFLSLQSSYIPIEEYEDLVPVATRIFVATKRTTGKRAPVHPRYPHTGQTNGSSTSMVSTEFQESGLNRHWPVHRDVGPNGYEFGCLEARRTIPFSTIRRSDVRWRDVERMSGYGVGTCKIVSTNLAHDC